MDLIKFCHSENFLISYYNIKLIVNLEELDKNYYFLILKIDRYIVLMETIESPGMILAKNTKKITPRVIPHYFANNVFTPFCSRDIYRVVLST